MTFSRYGRETRVLQRSMNYVSVHRIFARNLSHLNVLSSDGISPTSRHPFGKDVEIRSLPIDGGEPEVLIAFWGGQGTMNVPNWSLDGTHFAYMRFIAPE